MTGRKQWAFAMLTAAAWAASPAYAADVPDELELTIDVLPPGEALDEETVNRIGLPDSIAQALPAPGEAARQLDEGVPVQGDAPYAWPPDYVGSEPGASPIGDGSGWDPPALPERPTRPGD
jgi:hypothetical protein